MSPGQTGPYHTTEVRGKTKRGRNPHVEGQIKRKWDREQGNKLQVWKAKNPWPCFCWCSLNHHDWGLKTSSLSHISSKILFVQFFSVSNLSNFLGSSIPHLWIYYLWVFYGCLNETSSWKRFRLRNSNERSGVPAKSLCGRSPCEVPSGRRTERVMCAAAAQLQRLNDVHARRIMGEKVHSSLPSVFPECIRGSGACVCVSMCVCVWTGVCGGSGCSRNLALQHDSFCQLIAELNHTHTRIIFDD